MADKKVLTHFCSYVTLYATGCIGEGIMILFQTVISISAMVLQNCLFNNVCKRDLKTNDHIYRFNMIIYVVCIVLFGIAVLGRQVSFFTIALGLMFGVQ